MPGGGPVASQVMIFGPKPIPLQPAGGLGQVRAGIDTGDAVLARHPRPQRRAVAAGPVATSCAGAVLVADATVDADLHQIFGTRRLAVRTPQRRLHQPRLHQVETVEERRHLV